MMSNHQQHLSVSSTRTNGPSVPVDNATCISLVTAALQEAREKSWEKFPTTKTSSGESLSQKIGVTLDLSHRRIGSIPTGFVELIRDEIERLALAHNQLSSFPDEFASLPRLRYLNLRSNFLRELPVALTRLPSLEILDVSRNRLRTLPPDLGTLMNLRVLSMSKNKISRLPTYIADMKNLKVLKLDHNPITFPPKEIWEAEEKDRDAAWMDSVKDFLRQHAERSKSSQDTESGSSSDDVCDGDSIRPSISRSPSFESVTTDENWPMSPALQTIRPARSSEHGSIEDLSSSAVSGTAVNGSGQEMTTSNPVGIGIVSPFPITNGVSSSITTTDTSQSVSTVMSVQNERHRSNSESTLGVNREKRMGMPPPPRSTNPLTRPIPTFKLQTFRPVDEKSFKHTRGYSHDSVIDSGHNNSHIPARSPTDMERRPGQYFRRLSSLPEYKRASLSSAKVGEAARGVLYSISNLQRPIEQYIQSMGDPAGSESKAGRALFNNKMHVSALVSALEAYELKDDESAVWVVVDTCKTCIAAFRQVLSMLQSDLKASGFGSTGSDIRYMRTLLLMAYGSYVDLQCSYDVMKPLICPQTFKDGLPQRTSSLRARHYQPVANMAHSRQNTSSSLSVMDFNGSQLSAQFPQTTPKATDLTFNHPPTPGFPVINSDTGFEHENPLFQKFQAATNAAIGNLPLIERDIKATAAHNLQPPVTLKLREVSALCVTGSEAAKRLSKIRWDAIQEGDQNERKKFWDDTHKFTQLIINIAELIKSVTQEYTFPKRTLTLVGTVVRPTKDLYILMNDSAFRHMSEYQQQPQPGPVSNGNLFQSMTAPQMIGATPLSAALGPAAQATRPQIHPGSLGMSSAFGGYSSSNSRTGTLLSNYAPTMTSTVAEIGINFPGAVSNGAQGQVNGTNNSPNNRPIKQL